MTEKYLSVTNSIHCSFVYKCRLMPSVIRKFIISQKLKCKHETWLSAVISHARRQ